MNLNEQELINYNLNETYDNTVKYGIERKNHSVIIFITKNREHFNRLMLIGYYLLANKKDKLLGQKLCNLFDNFKF